MGKNHWELYFDALKSQDWEKALNSLNAILKKEPKNPQVHLKIGDVFQRAGDVSSAIAAYHQSAWLLMKKGFQQKALAIFKIILRLDPDNADAINKSKELLMEIESSKMKVPAIPPVEPIVEEKTREDIALQITGEVEKEVTVEPSAKIEDFLERTSYKEEMQKQITDRIQQKPEVKPVPLVPSFLVSLPENEIKQLMDRVKPQLFSAGQVVVEEGDSGDSVFVIKSGNAKVVAHILGKELELATLSPGDVFGEVAFLTGRPRTASVIAMDNLEVVEFNRLFLEEIFERYPDILKKMHDFYQSRVQDTLKKVKSRIKNRALKKLVPYFEK